MSTTTTTSTTTTRSWQLEKYSRSRGTASPSEPPAKRIKEGGGSDLAPTVLEWDHYTIPKLCLTIETTTTTSPSSPPSIHSQRLNITHSPSISSQLSPPTIDVLESLDLTSFSHPSVVAQTPLDQLPLKAVYRNTVVGIRYISVSPPSTTGKATVVFKRFQVRFQTVGERRDFVGLLEGVCPVKPAEEVSSGWSTGKEEGRRGTLGGRQDTIAPPPPPPPPSTILFPSSPIDPIPTFDIQHSLSPIHPAVIPTIQQPLPNNFAALFPHLTSTLLPPLPPISSLTCHDLTSLEETEFNVLLEGVLMDEGLEELVNKVEGSLKRKVGIK